MNEAFINYDILKNSGLLFLWERNSLMAWFEFFLLFLCFWSISLNVGVPLWQHLDLYRNQITENRTIPGSSKDHVIHEYSQSGNPGHSYRSDYISFFNIWFCIYILTHLESLTYVCYTVWNTSKYRNNIKPMITIWSTPKKHGHRL